MELLRNPREALLVPEAALLQQGEEHFVVRVGEDGSAERRQVQIGARRPGEVEILDGLAAGDRVITHGNDKVRPGQRVEVRALDDGSASLRDMLGPGS